VQYKVPAKLIRLIELTIINTTARIKINYEFTKEFKVESGVKQGHPLSATLFNVVVVVKQLDLRGNISTLVLQPASGYHTTPPQSNHNVTPTHLVSERYYP
jgi:hypothetical protein